MGILKGEAVLTPQSDTAIKQERMIRLIQENE